jgi:hypothetical protein
MKADRELRICALLFILSNPSVPALASPQDDAHDRLRDAFKACANQLGLRPPQAGARPPRLSTDQKAELDSCLEREGVNPADLPPPPGPEMQKFHQAMRACLVANGVDLPPPNPNAEPPRLSDAELSALDDCRESVHQQTSSQNNSQ